MALKIRILLLVLCILIICFFLLELADAESEKDLPLRDITEVIGTLMYDSSFSKNGNTVLRIRLKEVQNIFGNKASASGVLVLVGKDKMSLSAGTKIVAKGKFSNGLFIFDELTVSGKHRIQVVREQLIKWFENRLLGQNPSDGNLLCMALLLGRTEDYEFELRQKASECGVLHVLALSGMHLSILTRFCQVVFGKKKTGRTITFTLLSFFLFTAGPRPSLIRAYLMYIFRFLPIEESLIVSFTVHLVLFPLHVSDMGFVYGYLALFGLVFPGPLLKRKIRVYFPDSIAGVVCSTLSAICMTCPLQIANEGCWHICTFIVSPLAGFLSKLSMAGGLFTLLFGKNIVTQGFTDFVYWCFNRLLEYFSGFPECSITSYFVLLFAVSVVSMSSHFLKRVI